jgi:hypothetical protein
MSKSIQQANLPIDESISKHKHSYVAPPTAPYNESAAPVARAGDAIVGAFRAFGQDKVRYLLLYLLKLKRDSGAK